jgi:hypothetical protein
VVTGGFREWRRDAAAWLRSRGLELWIVTGVWAVLTLVIYLLAVGHESPRRFQDEFLFWALAKNFAHGDGLTWRGAGLGLRSWLYPVLLSPVFVVADSVPAQYTLVHLANSMMISAAVFPGYLMARLLVDRWRALAAALLVVSVPAMNYAGVIGTESLGYPVFTAACGAMLLALARPRPRNALLAFAAIFVAMLTRTQFVVLLPILALALMLAAAMQPSGSRSRYLNERRALLVGLAGLLVLAGLVLLVQGRSTFGLYAGAFDGLGLSWSATVFWVKAFSADVYLLAAIVPVIATLAMFGRAANRHDPLIGALLAITLVASLVLIAQVSWFSATNPYEWRARHIFYERYMFYLGPLYFSGLLAAQKRVSWGAAIFSAAVATVIVSGFQTDAVLVPFSYDSFGLSLVGRHMELHPDSAAQIGMLLARLTFLLGVVYVLSTLPHKLLHQILYWGLVVFTFGALVISQAQAWHYARIFSADAFSRFPGPANFIDKHTSESVGMIITSTDDPLSYFTTEFWNSRVTRVYATDKPPIVTPVMYSPRCEFGWTKTGRITSRGAGCGPVPNAWYLRSDNVVMHLKDETTRVHPSASWPTLTLMVGEPPARILSLTDGRKVRSGLVQLQMNVRTFLDDPGRLRVRLRAFGGESIVTAGGRSVRVRPGPGATLTLPLKAGETVTVLRPASTGGLPATVSVTGLDISENGGLWQSIL